jgi:nitrate/nitrite-specific signal transduction histidine kinase
LAVVDLPIRPGIMTIAVFFWNSKELWRPMTKEHRLTAKNAALKEELAKRKKILSSIYKISQLLIHPNNHVRILQRILQESHRIFGFTRSVILLLNKEKDRLEATYCIGFTPEEETRAFTRPLYMKTISAGNHCRENGEKYLCPRHQKRSVLDRI